MPHWDPTICFLFDNGSLRAASTLSLRELAAELEIDLGVAVQPVSLLHSSGIDPAALGGEPAQLLEPALRDFAANGGRRAVALPLFFGPSAALTDYVPERVAAIRRTHPTLDVRLAPCLVTPDDDSADRVAAAIGRDIARAMHQRNWSQPAVVLVDHGSPRPAVAQVRDAVGARLRERMRDVAEPVLVSSMERREGTEYDFNEPLLERALTEVAAAGQRRVIVALQFLQAGRHAGSGGDIAAICARVGEQWPNLETTATEPMGKAPEIRELLRRRYTEAVTASSSTR